MLTRKLAGTAGQRIDMTELFMLFAFDVTGDVVFGTRFDMVQGGKRHFAMEVVRSGWLVMGYTQPIPWFLRVVVAIPGVMRPWFRLLDWAKQEVIRRLKVGAPVCAQMVEVNADGSSCRVTRKTEM